MRFGLFYQASEADGQTHAERYAEMLDLIALGDTLEFDVAWLAELHFGGAFSLLASPLMVVPVIAQRTRTIRRSEEHTSELQSRLHLVCRLLLEKKKTHRSRYCFVVHGATLSLPTFEIAIAASMIAR